MKHLTAIDVIKMPPNFMRFANFNYMELADKDYSCTDMSPDNFDLAFSYNVFCHLSNDALREYINVGAYKVVKPGADFIFMLANFKYTSQKFEGSAEYKREDNRLTPIGHYHQDEKTVHDIVDTNLWEIVNDDLVPHHRDIVIHLRKKTNVSVRLPWSNSAWSDNPVITKSFDTAVAPVKNYSQNNEQEIVRNYFGSRGGILLDIGANDGETYSNSRQLMLDGWGGVFIEPSPKAYERLSALYKGNVNAVCLQYGIGKEVAEVEFWESGAFNHTGPDVALVSCIDPKEKERWGATVKFDPIKIRVVPFDKLVEIYKSTGDGSDPKFNFINIDAEGMDYEILKQIDLNKIGCECFCIEHNSVPDMIQKYRAVADYFGFREIGFNAENLIFAK